MRRKTLAPGDQVTRYRQHICTAADGSDETELALRFRSSRPRDRYMPNDGDRERMDAQEQQLLIGFVNEVIDRLGADSEAAEAAAS